MFYYLDKRSFAFFTRATGLSRMIWWATSRESAPERRARDRFTVALLAVAPFRCSTMGFFLRTAPRPPIEDVDSIPLPAYELLDLDRYAVAESARHTPKYKRAIQIFTSRGCPWRCTYCHDLFGKKFHPRSPGNVFREIELLYHDFAIREFMIEDDIFNFDMDRAKKICDLIIESDMEIALQFGNGVRLERLDEELIQKLAAAGTHHMCIAIESARASPEMAPCGRLGGAD